MTKPSCGFALCLVVLITGVAGAEVKIAAEHRIKNRPPGRCGWCAVETLARHHKLTDLYGLSKQYACRCTADSLEEVLKEFGATYRLQRCGETDREILRYAMRKELGAVVGFREPYPGAGGHIVTLIDFGTEEVKVIDSNDQDGRTRTMSLARFLHWWDGFAVVLEPKAAKKITKAVVK
jgi:hypothetical protein